MSQTKTGLLVLPLANHKNIYPILRQAGKFVERKLYIDLLQSYSNVSKVKKNDYFRLLATVYSRPKDVCDGLDLCVLLPTCSNGQALKKRILTSPIDLFVIAEDDGVNNEDIENNLKRNFDYTKFDLKVLNTETNSLGAGVDLDTDQYNFNFSKTFSGVVIGGTFDRLHDGHKLLIQTALLLAERKLTVGVADGPLLEKKILKELIEPIDVRVKNVVDIIHESKPGIEHKVVPIHDPCGPSGTDDDLQLLLVSEETIRGGPVVNETRALNGLPKLHVMNINLVGESPSDLAESLNSEGKLSSSAQRVRELGHLLRPPNKPIDKEGCYVIGVTGGIASGKSSVVKRLEALGAYTVDCDLLGHKAYEPGQPAYKRVVQEFGNELLKEDSTIDRKKLGPIVFCDKSKLELLNSIVWPEIHRMKQEIIERVSREGTHRVVVFEGAILFEAGWEREANEVWCCTIPKDEAVQRIINRNSLTAEAALRRIDSQMGNEERVGRSHVVLSTLWEPEFTQKQCEKAWSQLYERLGLPLNHQSSL